MISDADPLLAIQLREQPWPLSERDTRIRVLAIVRSVRARVIVQLGALQQWEDALHQ